MEKQKIIIIIKKENIEEYNKKKRKRKRILEGSDFILSLPFIQKNSASHFYLS